MAVVNVPQPSAIGFRIQAGTTTTGKPLYKTRNFSNVNADATDADLYAVVEALSGLQEHIVTDYVRTDKSMLINQ